MSSFYQTLLHSDLRFTALTTIFASAVYQSFGVAIGAMRTKHNVKFPEVHGPQEFNRAFRIQQNTLEQLPNFLISLWLSSLFYDAQIASVLGCAWVVMRLFYASAYRNGEDITRWTIPAYMINNLNLVLAVYAIAKSFVFN